MYTVTKVSVSPKRVIVEEQALLGGRVERNASNLWRRYTPLRVWSQCVHGKRQKATGSTCGGLLGLLSSQGEGCKAILDKLY